MFAELIAIYYTGCAGLFIYALKYTNVFIDEKEYVTSSSTIELTELNTR